MLSTALMSLEPANTLWSEELKLNLQLTTVEDTELQGCSPGYWKNHEESWDGNSPDFTAEVQHSDRFVDWFGSIPPQFDTNDTLLTVAQTGGGQLVALARHAAAHLATAEAHELGFIPGYPFTRDDVIALYQQAVTSGDYATAEKKLTDTEVNCPLGEPGDKGSFGVASSFAFPFEEEASGLTAFEEWAGIGPLPPIPAECRGIVFEKVFVMRRPGTYLSAGANDLIFGSYGDDVIRAEGGDDCIVAGGGNDEVYAGPGNNVGFAGSGNDRLWGLEGADNLYGDDGNDKLWGGSGSDGLNGGAGDDRCAGEAEGATETGCEQSPGPATLEAVFDAQMATISLTWAPVTGAVSYNVFVATNGGAEFRLSQATEPVFVHQQVVMNQTYTYRVTAVDFEGVETAPSAAVLVQTLGPTPTATPLATARPDLTATPEPTATLEATATPQPTTTTEPTSTPQPTSTPEPTATPQPTATPEPTVTEEPTATPEPSSTPAATPTTEEEDTETD
jgi:hypothetical protein